MNILDLISIDELGSPRSSVRLKIGDEKLIEGVHQSLGLKETDLIRSAITVGTRVELVRRMLERGVHPDTVIAVIDGEKLTARHLAQTLVSTTSNLLEFLIQCGSPPALIKQAMDIISHGTVSGTPVPASSAYSENQTREDASAHSASQGTPEVEIRVDASAKNTLRKMGVRRVQWGTEESGGSR